MAAEKELPSRDFLLDGVARAATLGSLGLFVGTGFSKAATEEGERSAPSFEELLTRLAPKLGLSLEFDKAPYSRKSLPQVASELLSRYSDRIKAISEGHQTSTDEREKLPATAKPSEIRERAESLFRQHICQLCNLAPEEVKSSKLKQALTLLMPSWVITTNYDLVLESLLEHSESILPFRPLVPSTTRTPIFHLHGHRHHPSSIKVTEEDYVSLLGPFDYARLKLPLLIFESTTLMLGYGLGDINVRAAMAWSRSLRDVYDQNIQGPLQGDVVQALFKVNPRSEPYTGPTGELVIEIGDLARFLSDLAARREQMVAEILRIQSSIQAFQSEHFDPSSLLEINSKDRAQFLRLVKILQNIGETPEIITILNNVFDKEWAGSITNFDVCVKLLKLLIAILQRVDLGSCHPSLLAYIAESLDKLGIFIVKSMPTGSSYGATSYWQATHNKIQADVLQELWSIGMARHHKELIRIFHEFEVI